MQISLREEEIVDPLEDLLTAVRQHGPDIMAYRALGAIHATLHPDGELLLFNYTPQATFGHTWPPLERICRGLIVHWSTARVVARPFDKFFNLNEVPETRPQALPEGLMEVTEKLDGSLGILFPAPDGPAIATRGSFTGSQARWATAFLRAHHRLDGLPPDLTLLFEIIYPTNRVVVDYGDREELTLIGARWLDGRDVSYAELTELGQRFYLPVVPMVTVADLDALITLTQTAVGVEGWVLRFSNGLRVKLKTLDYIQLNRFLVGLTPAKIRDLLAESPDRFQDYLLALPDELQPEAHALSDAIIAQTDSEVARLQALFAGPLATMAQATRREFAETVRRDYPADAPLLFNLLDGRDIRASVLHKLDVSTMSLSPVLRQRTQRAREG